MKTVIKPRYTNVKALREAFSTALGIIQELTRSLGYNGIIEVQNPVEDLIGYFTGKYDILLAYTGFNGSIALEDIPSGIWFYSYDEPLEDIIPHYILQIENLNREHGATVYLYFISPVENA